MTPREGNGCRDAKNQYGSADTIRNSIQRQRNGQCHPNATPGALPGPPRKYSSVIRPKSITGGGNRTHTGIPAQRILSPVPLSL